MIFKEDLEMSAPPSMELYIGDLWRSTAGMSAEVFGAYMRLLMYQWEHGSLPERADERQLVCGVTQERWDAVWARIRERFVPLDDSGRLGHPRMARDRPEAIARWEENKRIAETRRKAGSKGGRKRAENQADQPQTNFSSSKQNPKQTSKQTSKQNSSKSQAYLEGGRGKGEDGKGKTEKGRGKTEVDAVVEHYQSYHPRAKPGKKERNLIAARLAEGYSVEDLKQAIDGIHVRPWNCGENPGGNKYQTLELVVRNSDHVAKYMEAWDQRDAPVLSERERRGLRAKMNVLKKFGETTDDKRLLDAHRGDGGDLQPGGDGGDIRWLLDGP